MNQFSFLDGDFRSVPVQPGIKANRIGHSAADFSHKKITNADDNGKDQRVNLGCCRLMQIDADCANALIQWIE